MSFSVVGGDELDDPSDFQATTFQDLDEHLRCPICKEFFVTTMILTTCSHSFCALCIRRSLTTEQICPKCRKPASDHNLIHNYDLDHVVGTWRESRSFLLEADRKASTAAIYTETTVTEEYPQSITISRSLPIIDNDNSDDFVLATQSTKRSKSTNTSPITTRKSTRLGGQSQALCNELSIVQKKGKAPQLQSHQVPTEQYNTKQPTYTQRQESPEESEPLKSTSLVQCPVCLQTMKYLVLDKHLDRCMKGDCSIPPSPPPPTSSSSSSNGLSSSLQNISTTASYTGATMSIPLALKKSPKPIDLGRKPSKVVYAMQSDKEMRKNLKDLGLPDHGDRSIRIWRHKEYISLYNANYDSQTPVSASVLVQRLAVIEYSYLNDKNNQAKRKTTDSNQHMHRYKSEFNILIEDAKKRRMEKEKNESSPQSTSTNNNNQQ